MARLELTDEEALMLHQILETRWEEILKEIRHTDHREFRELLRSKAAMLEKLVRQLAPAGVTAR